MPSVIDTLSNRQEIIDAMLAGQPDRVVSKLAGISHVAVAKYRRAKLLPAIQAATEMKRIQRLALVDRPTASQFANDGALARQALEGDAILSRLSKKKDARDRWLVSAEKDADYRTCAQIDRGDTSALELEARLTGRLDAPTTIQQNTIVLVLPAATQANVDGPAAMVLDVTGDK